MAIVLCTHGKMIPWRDKSHHLYRIAIPKFLQADPDESPFPHELRHSKSYIPLREHSHFDFTWEHYPRAEGGAVPGSLSKKGANSSHDLGLKLGKLYIEDGNLAEPIFDGDKVRAYTIRHRALLRSLEYLLAAMFDGRAEDKVPLIFTEENENEYRFPNIFFCEKLRKMVQTSFRVMPNINAFNEGVTKIAEMLDLNKEHVTSENIDIWVKNIEFMMDNAYPVPDRFVRALPLMQTTYLQMYNYSISYARHMAPMLSCGMMVEDILEYIYRRTTAFPVQDLHINMVFRSTLYALLQAMGCNSQQWLPESSYMAFELHRVDEQWKLRVILNDQPLDLRGSEDGFVALKK